MEAGTAVAAEVSREHGSAAGTVRFHVRAVLEKDEYERACNEPLFPYIVEYVESLPTFELPKFFEVAAHFGFRERTLRQRLATVGIPWRTLRGRLVAAVILEVRAAGWKMGAIRLALGYASKSSVRRAAGRILGLRRGARLPSGHAVYETVSRLCSRELNWLCTFLSRRQEHEQEPLRRDDGRNERPAVALVAAQRLAEVG